MFAFGRATDVSAPRAAVALVVVAALAVAGGCAARGKGAGRGASKAAARALAAAAALRGDVTRGAAIYRKACASCHGAEGDGRGPVAAHCDPWPRNFVRAVYRYRSTPSGSLPRDADIARTILVGLPGTEMPAWRDHLSLQDVVDVVAYVKSFSKRFKDEEIDKPVKIPAPVPYSAASVARGAQAYKKVQCGKCHGARGRGDGWAKADEMKDALGRVVRAADFTGGIYRSGNRKQDLYRTFVTGLDGTPMPGYENSLKPGEVYDLINFLLSLERSRGVWYWLSTPPRWYRPGAQRVRR